jgi:hypothetical protein
MSARSTTLDDFTVVSGWSAVTSGLARLHIAPDHGPQGGAMRRDFDFRGGGGFVVARKHSVLELAEDGGWTWKLVDGEPHGERTAGRR